VSTGNVRGREENDRWNPQALLELDNSGIEAVCIVPPVNPVEEHHRGLARALHGSKDLAALVVHITVHGADEDGAVRDVQGPIEQGQPVDMAGSVYQVQALRDLGIRRPLRVYVIVAGEVSSQLRRLKLQQPCLVGE